MAMALLLPQLLNGSFCRRSICRLSSRGSPRAASAAKCKLLRRFAPPPPLHEVETARDLAWCHRPDIRRRIVGGNEGIDRFR
jgi:hypothetical protein